MIRGLKELDALKDLSQLASLDLAFNTCQKIKFYKIIIIHKLPQLRSLDGVEITAQNYVKAGIFYGDEVEDKKKIFKTILPEEEYIDRRIFTSYMLDPDSDTEPADYDFFDKYDENGNRIEEKPGYLPADRAYPFGTGKGNSGVEPMMSTVNLEFVAQSVDYMRQQIMDYLKEHSQHHQPEPHTN